MEYGLSNGNVTDDVTWPWKVKLVTTFHHNTLRAMRLERNIAETAGFRLRSNGPPIGNGPSVCLHVCPWRWGSPFRDHIRPSIGRLQIIIRNMHFCWWNVLDYMCRMGHWSSWFWFEISRSTFDKNMSEKWFFTCSFQFPVTLIFNH